MAQLKDMLKAEGLSTVGLKSDLINRLRMHDPTGMWVEKEMSDGASAIVSEDSGVSAVPSADLPRPPSPPSESVDVRDMNILRKERELAEREVQLLRREVEMMREMQRFSMGGQLSQNSVSQVERYAPVVVNEAIKAMLDYFDGNGGALDTWVRQLALLRMTYQLDSGENVSGVKAERPGS